MNYVRYIETLAWVLFIGMMGLWISLFCRFAGSTKPDNAPQSGSPCLLPCEANQIRENASAEKYVRCIEALAWVLLVVTASIWASLWLSHSVPFFYNWPLWQLWLESFVPAAGATILGCQAQRPLGVRGPSFVRILLAAMVLSFAACLLSLVALCLNALWIGNQLTWCAFILLGFFALAFSMLHPALWNSPFSAVALAAGLLSPLLFSTLGTRPSLVATLLYFPTVLGLYAASLVFRRE